MANLVRKDNQEAARTTASEYRWDPFRMITQLALSGGMLRQVLERRAEQPGRRLLAGREQERRGAHH